MAASLQKLLVEGEENSQKSYYSSGSSIHPPSYLGIWGVGVQTAFKPQCLFNPYEVLIFQLWSYPDYGLYCLGCEFKWMYRHSALHLPARSSSQNYTAIHTYSLTSALLPSLPALPAAILLLASSPSDCEHHYICFFFPPSDSLDEFQNRIKNRENRNLLSWLDIHGHLLSHQLLKC